MGNNSMQKLQEAFRATLARYSIENTLLEINLLADVRETLTDGYLFDRGREKIAALENSQREDFIDVHHFPPDVASIILVVCELWSLKPPHKNKSKGGEYAMWIEKARELQDSCGDIHFRVLLANVKQDYDARTADNNGEPPFIVSGPNSLIRVARAKAGQLRSKQGVSRNDRSDSRFSQSSFDF